MVVWCLVVVGSANDRVRRDGLGAGRTDGDENWRAVRITPGWRYICALGLGQRSPAAGSRGVR